MGQPLEITTCELPLERLCRLLIASLEGEQVRLEFLKTGELVRRHYLSLEYGEVYLNLVEPTRVDRKMNLRRVGIPRGQVGQCAATFVLELHGPRLVGGGFHLDTTSQMRMVDKQHLMGK